jgi:hypothetical protein
MYVNNISAALIGVARSLMQKMRETMSNNGMPHKVADRIARSTYASGVSNEGNTYSVKVAIDLSKEAAPMAAVYEFGIDEYPIPAEGTTLMVFPNERWPQYEPPPPAPDKFVFMKVIHPAVEATPYVQPSIEANRDVARKLLGRAFVESFVVRGKTEYRIEVA